MNNLIIVLIAVLHLELAAAMLLAGRRHGKPLGVGGCLFCFLIPVFGPVCGLELTLSHDPDPRLLRELTRNQDPIRRSYIAPDLEAPTAAPMEEAFLISTPTVRREMMMRLLHEAPDENVELLMMARFNDDPETAHYATATLTEYQRVTEMTLQQSQTLLQKQPDNQSARLDYIRQMEAYIDSGLLEGHLLQRQRRLLEQELDRLPADQLNLELGCLRSKNLLALGRASEAAQTTRELTARFPGAEEPYLALMRVYVDSQNAQGLRALRTELESSSVLWSYQGREKMEYFLKGIS